MRNSARCRLDQFLPGGLIGAANDIIATHFEVSVESVTWAVRIGLFVVPGTAFAITKRVALGLQREDRDQVLHGRGGEGIIKRLPDGEFIEVHAPLGPERCTDVLTQHEQYRPIGPGPSDGAGGPRSGRGVARRLRARLSRDFNGGDAQIAKPTEAEYKGDHRRRIDAAPRATAAPCRALGTAAL